MSDQKNSLPAAAEDMAIDLKNILPSLAKNLYGDDWRISIRELLQNAHDALAERTQWGKREGPQIDLIPDLDNGTLTFQDNGIGMTLEEVRTYLATVGYGRKREQIEKLNKDGQANRDLKNIIGQYGIGFLSSFIIADRVDVYSKSVLKPDAPGVHAVFTGETKWYHEPSGTCEPGTKVVVHLKKQPVSDPTTGKTTFLAELLNFQRLLTEVRRFGDLLPFQVYVHRNPSDRTGQLGNTADAPWEKPTCTTNQLLEFLKTRHTGENEPLYAQAFKFSQAGAQVDAHGVLYIPNPPAHQRRSFESMSRVDLFCRRMFITDDIPSLLPEWASFVGVVVECPDLTPTLNRNDVVRHDPAFVRLKEALSREIISVLVTLAEKLPKDFYQFLDAHTERLHSSMLEDWKQAPGRNEEKDSFFGALINHLPLNIVDRSRPTGQPMTLTQYRKELSPQLSVESQEGFKRDRIYVLGDATSWGQYRAMILQKDLPVIIPSGQGEPLLLKAYGQVFGDEVDMKDVREMLDSVYVDKVDQTSYEALKQFLKGLDGGGPDDVHVAKFSPNYVPAFMTTGITDSSSQAKVLENFLSQGGSVLDPKLRRTIEEAMLSSRAGRVSLTLTLNASNLIIQRLKDHCAQGKQLSGVPADVLHEVFHNARALSDPHSAVSDHYFEHRNSLLANLLDVATNVSDLESSNARLKVELDVLKSRGGMTGTKRCALLLTDLKRSTLMMSYLDSEKSAPIIRNYANHIREIVERHGGAVEKFTGDGIFAYFAKPESNPEVQAQKAASCAFEILGATNTFFAQKEVKDTLMDAVGIGFNGCRTALHYGDASFCEIAGQQAVVGRNVVTLFRTLQKESLFKQYGIIMTNAFYQRLAPAVQLQAVHEEIELDPSLPKATFYPHPSLVAPTPSGTKSGT